jgi:hypothetical protein
MGVASDRLDLKLSSEDKELLIQAAAIKGMSLAAFVRSVAKKQALDAFHAAIHEPFRPAPPLEDAQSSLYLPLGPQSDRRGGIASR